MMKIWRFAASLGLVTAIVWFYHAVLGANSTSVALTMLLAILGISTRWGLAEAAAASVLAVLGLNFFFLPPVGTLTIDDPQNWVALLAFLVTAATASQLSARARKRAAEAEERRREVERLYALVQGVMLSRSPRAAVRELIDRVLRIFGVEGAAFYSLAADEAVRTGTAAGAISDHDLKVAAELDGPSTLDARALALAPVRMGARPLGGLAIVGRLPSAGSERQLTDPYPESERGG